MKELLEALCDPTRVKIVRALRETTLAAGDLAKVINRSGLKMPHAGPGIVEEYDSTCLVPPGWTAHLDGYGNIVMHR